MYPRTRSTSHPVPLLPDSSGDRAAGVPGLWIWWCGDTWAWPVILFLLARRRVGPILFGNTACDRRVRGRGGALVMAGRPVSIKPLAGFRLAGCAVASLVARAAALVVVSLRWDVMDQYPVITQNSSAQLCTLGTSRYSSCDRRVDGPSRRGECPQRWSGLARAPETRSELTVGQIAPNVDRRLGIAIRKTPAFRLGQPMR